MLRLEWKYVIIGLAGLFGLYLVGTALFRPLKFLIRLTAWTVLGVALLLAINAVFGYLGFHIAINPLTILTAGILQLPGVVLLVMLNVLFIG
ncbi:pro-sigmaK processing inhibitor BofA family protein [Pelotomaculum sp. FP]|uniref:pro-sigmaK processing inhibitor BofA family protein n=1 Tax=Pelotomaculum sp. FP TaxID=261474 RepID=UPI0032B734CA